jgi:hypothetical protein
MNYNKLLVKMRIYSHSKMISKMDQFRSQTSAKKKIWSFKRLQMHWVLLITLTFRKDLTEKNSFLN